MKLWIWRDVSERRCLLFRLWEMASPCLSSSTFPHSCGWTTHILSDSRSFMHTYKGLHTCTRKRKLFPSRCNMNRHVHAASHLDVTALPGLLCYIKNSTPIIVKATSRWRWICSDLTEVTWMLLSSVSVYFGDDNFILLFLQRKGTSHPQCDTSL